MSKPALTILTALLFIGVFLAADVPAQQEQQGRQVQSGEETAYGSLFFDQLRSVFGKFRQADLQVVFRDAKPIECSELVGRKGEWRTVAFFNENRQLGDWCRESLEEVKADLAVYTFKGVCGEGHDRVQVVTEFPTAPSVSAYNRREIGLNEIDVTVNDPVNATLNPRTMAYTFELPYLFLTGRQGSTNVYSLMAPKRDAAYVTDVANRCECKSVSSKDLTYRFFICRGTIVSSGLAARNQRSAPAFGASAFFILSDGTEAQTRVHLLFGDGTDASKPADTVPAPTPPARPVLKRPKA